MSALAKPILRGHVRRKGIKDILLSFVCGGLASSWYYFFIARPRKIAYEEFRRTYDPEAHYKELRAYGYLKSPHGRFE